MVKASARILPKPQTALLPISLSSNVDLMPLGKRCHWGRGDPPLSVRPFFFEDFFHIHNQIEVILR